MIRPMLRSIILIGLGIMLTSGCGGQSVQPDPEPIVGVKIYETDRDLPGLFAEWRSLGITAVFAPEELASSEGFRRAARTNARAPSG